MNKKTLHDFGCSVGRKARIAVPTLALAALATVAAHATDTPDTYTLSTTPYAGVVTNTGTFINSMISSYGVPAIFIGVAISGLMFAKRIAKGAFH